MSTNSKRYVFLVDDEPIQNEMLKDYLTERFIYDLLTFDNGEDAIEKMDLQPEIVILDFHLNSHNPEAKNGVDILKQIKEQWPETYVIMLSGQDRIDVAIETMKYGSYDYVVKGESAFSRIENLLNNINEVQKMKAMNIGYRNTITLLTIVIGLIVLVSVYHFYLKHLFFN